MRAFFLLTLAALPALAATNQMKVTLPCNDLSADAFLDEFKQVGQQWCDSSDGNKIKEWDGTSWNQVAGSTAGQMSSFPLQFARPFLDGEIMSYPQVKQDGSPLTTQAVIKQRYPSGYVKHAIITVVLPSLTASGSTLTFDNQVSANDTAPTRDDLLNSIADMDAKITFTPDSNNCPGCTTKTASARAMLTAIPNVIPKCEGTTRPPCLWSQGAVATTVILADHANKAYDIGWKQSNAKTWGQPVLSISNVSGRPATAITGTVCTSNVCTITAAAHRLSAGDLVTISGSGITGLDGTARVVASVPSVDTITVSQSFTTASQIRNPLILSGSGSGGTLTPTRITVSFANAPTAASDHPLWPGDSVTFASVGGAGLTGGKVVQRIAGANAFQIDFTPTGVYTSGGTATLSVIAASNPNLPISNASGLSAPLWIRDSLTGTFSKNNRVCSIDNSATPPRLKTGNEDCQEFTISELSLSDTASTVTVPNAAQMPGTASWSGWAFARDRVWLLDDGSAPLELVQISSISGSTVTFSNSNGVRTLLGGTRSSHAGTIKLKSIGRASFFSNPKRPTNFGTGITIASTPNAYPSTYGEITTQADQVYRTIRPIFYVTVWHGLGKYQVRAVAEIADSQRFGDQFYQAGVTVGSASPVKRYPVLSYERDRVWPHPAGSRWSRKYWGPGSHYPLANIDIGMDYVRDTRLTYYYDLDKLLSTNGRDYEINEYLQMHRDYKDLLGIAYYQPYMGDYGGRPEIGPYTRAATRALMCGALTDCWKIWWIAERHGEQLSTFTVHYREGAPDPAIVATAPTDVGALTPYLGRNGCSSLGDSCDQLDVDRISGLGRVLSIRAHSKVDLKSANEGNQNTYVGAANAADQVRTRGARHMSIQQVDTAHTYDHSTPIYGLNGDHFFLEEAQFSAAFDSAQESRTAYTSRGPDDGTYGCCGYAEPRGLGRKLIKKANVAFVTPDGTPEKTYFSQQVKEWIVAETDSREMKSSYGSENGMRALRDWARDSKSKEHWINNYTVYQGPSPLGQWLTDDAGKSGHIDDPEFNGAITHQYSTMWEHNILVFALGRAEEVGFTGARTLKEWMGKLSVNILTTPGINRHLAAMYYTPTTVLGWNSVAEIQAALDVVPQSAHCAPTGVTTADFMNGSTPQTRGQYLKNLRAFQCAHSNLGTIQGTPPNQYYAQGYKADIWRYADTKQGCDAQASYSLHLLSAISMLRGVPNFDAAWDVASNEILNGSCSPSWRDNPEFSFLPRPAGATPIVALTLSPNSWTPSCIAGSSLPIDFAFSVTITDPPDVSYTLASSAGWLSFKSGANGLTPASAVASVDCSQLTPGSYAATITASANGVTNGPASVALTVKAPVVQTVSLTQTKVAPTSTVFVMRRSVSDACTILIQGVAPITWPAGLLVETMYKAGLTPSTVYPTTVTCGSGAQWNGTITTGGGVGLAPGESAVSVAPPQFLTAAKVRLEYGPDANTSEGAVTSPCSSGCTVLVPGSLGVPKFYRLKWQTVNDQTLAVSDVRLILPN